MIFGRNTVQVMGLITATATFIQLVIATLAPMLHISPEVVTATGIIIGGAVTVLGVWITVLANTSTTPTETRFTPTLQQGTDVKVTNSAGAEVGTVRLDPPPPGPQ